MINSENVEDPQSLEPRRCIERVSCRRRDQIAVALLLCRLLNAPVQEYLTNTPSHVSWVNSDVVKICFRCKSMGLFVS